MQYLLDTNICVFFLRGKLNLDKIIREKGISNAKRRNLIEQQPCPLQKEHTETGHRPLMSFPHCGHRFFGRVLAL